MALVLNVSWSERGVDATIRDLTTDIAVGHGRAEHITKPSAVHDPDHWVDTCERAVRLAAANCASAGHVTSDLVRIEISTASAGDGCSGGVLALDGNNELVHPPLVTPHLDSATDAEWIVEHRQGVRDFQNDVLNRSGVDAPLPTAGGTAALLAWLHRNAPDAWRASTRFTTPAGWLLERFGADPAVGTDDARNSALLDTRRTDHWDLDALALIDAERDWLSALPPIVETNSPVGLLTAEVAERFGLREALPLHAASHPTR